MAKYVTKSGEELDDAAIEKLADEAEQGYPPEAFHRVPFRGRPSLSGGPGHSETIRVRVENELAEAVRSEAAKQDISLSEYVRSVLRKHVPTS